MAEGIRSSWEQAWHSHDSETCQKADAAIAALIQQMDQDTINYWCVKVTAEAIRQAAREVKANTAVGIDHVRFSELAKAENGPLEELAEIYRETLRERAWPSQTLAVLVGGVSLHA